VGVGIGWVICGGWCWLLGILHQLVMRSTTTCLHCAGLIMHASKCATWLYAYEVPPPKAPTSCRLAAGRVMYSAMVPPLLMIPSTLLYTKRPCGNWLLTQVPLQYHQQSCKHSPARFRKHVVASPGLI
jgi:hypothetical protein